MCMLQYESEILGYVFVNLCNFHLMQLLRALLKMKLRISRFYTLVLFLGLQTVGSF